MTDIIRSTPSDQYFAAQPRVVKHKKKYRRKEKEEEETEPRYRYQNLMWEKRVVRGNTYSSYMVAQRELEEMDSGKRKKRRRIQRNQDENYNDMEGTNDYEYTGMMIAPPPGCSFAEAYTDEGVETETDLPPCHDATTQTEFVIEKKLPDLSMPVYTGVHKETQIYASENLFDFDYEAEPVVQVLVTRCLEESRIEVVEEEELRVLKERQEHLQRINDQEEQDRRDLEERERQKDKRNKDRNDQRRRKKREMIDTHQHMISRVYTKRFLGDVHTSAFEILENMCMFMDEGEKEIKDNFMPWLYQQTLQISKGRHQSTKETDHVIDGLNNGILATHRHSVFSEMERRRLAKEEEERLLREREERRRKKLEFKLKRREDRRLYYKEADITEMFISKGDVDNEIVNISDFDGSDAGGNKSIGFRGGLIGEYYLFMKKLKSNEKFQNVQFNNNIIANLWESLFGEFVTQGWTIYIGLKLEFERNYKEIVEDFQFGSFDLEYVRSIDDPDEYDHTIDFILKHYVSVFFTGIWPKLALNQEKELAKLRPPEPVEGGGGEEEPKEEGEEEEDDDEKEPEEEKKVEAKEPAQEEEEAEEEQEETDKEYREFQEFAFTIIRRILNRASGISNVKFNLTEEFEEKKKAEEDDEEADDTSQDKEEAEQGNAKPMGLCLFIPEPEPEEEEIEETVKKEGEGEEEAVEQEEKTVEEGDQDGEEEEKEPEEVYLKPYVPKEEFFTQKFTEDLTQIEHILSNARVQSIHYPLLVKFRSTLLDIAMRILKVDMEDEEVTEFLNTCNLETIQEIREYVKQRDGLDLMYINTV